MKILRKAFFEFFLLVLIVFSSGGVFGANELSGLLKKIGCNNTNVDFDNVVKELEAKIDPKNEKMVKCLNAIKNIPDKSSFIKILNSGSCPVLPDGC